MSMNQHIQNENLFQVHEESVHRKIIHRIGQTSTNKIHFSAVNRTAHFDSPNFN